MIRFKYTGPTRVGFADLGRELGPGEEFDVPEHLALRFAEHGHCTCLEPEKLAPLRTAEQDAQDAQDAARDAAGLVYAHPVAAAAAIERAAARGAQEPAAVPAPVVDEPAAAAEPAPAETEQAASKRAAKSATSAK